jgi:hypothetical protein
MMQLAQPPVGRVEMVQKADLTLDVAALFAPLRSAESRRVGPSRVYVRQCTRAALTAFVILLRHGQRVVLSRQRNCF